MYKGGSNYTASSANIIRYAGLFVPVILVLYGLCAKLGLVASYHFYNDASFFVISFWWIYISVIQFMAPSKTRLDSALRLTAYHLLAGAYLLFVAGIASPFTVFWILLILAANTYFGNRGVKASIGWFTLVVLIDIFLWHGISAAIVVYDVVTLVAIIVAGLIILALAKTQQVDREELVKIKAQELLQRDRTLTIVNNLADAILSTDKNGVIRVYNAACLNLLDTNDSLNGKHIEEVLKLSDTEHNNIAFLELLQNAKSAQKRDDLIYSYDDEESIRLEVTYSPIRSSNSRTTHGQAHDGYIVILRDVTKSKSLEEERDEFISVVSHELRTPITIVEGTISNTQVMMEHPNATKKMLTDAMTMAHDQIVYLARMVNDLSTLSRAERGVADNAEEIDVREMIHKLHDEYGKEAVKKGLHLNLDLGAVLGTVSASRLYLEEMLQNFITNAIKYTKKGTVTISVKQRTGTVTFSVKDSGIGISKSDQAKVFDKFYRSEDYRTRETSGTGLGLYVTAKLAHKLKTQITLVSRLNHGSTFSFSMPVTSTTIKKK